MGVYDLGLEMNQLFFATFSKNEPSRMILDYQPFFLEFKHPFGVSSNTRTGTATVFVRLMANGKIGYGEACLPAYLGETTDGTIAFLELAKPVLKRYDFSFTVPAILESIDLLLPGHNAAKTAIDIALHDLLGKMEEKPCYELLALAKTKPMPTSITIGIDTEEKIGQKIKEAIDFSILKIKAGTINDKKLVESIRNFTDKPLYVDVNQGWKDKYQALDMAHWLNDKGVLLLEQPMPVAMRDEMAWLTAQSPLPIMADESVKRLKDLIALKGVFSGINIKLMKCTGLQEALKMITYARKNNLKILLGCMAESSCATSAMAQLMSYADYIDLDAPNLLRNDPFTGVLYQSGNVVLNDLPGIGVRPANELFKR